MPLFTLATLWLIVLFCPRLCAQAPRSTVPQKDWSVQAFLAAGDRPDTFGFQMEAYPSDAFAYLPDKAGIRATVMDTGGRLTQANITLLPEPPAIPSYGLLIRKHDPPGLIWLGFRWEPQGLSPGMYTLTITVPFTATNVSGQPFTLPAATDSIRVYLPPPPERLPAQTPGQRFLCLPDWVEDLPYLDAHNQTVQRARLALKLFTLKHIDRIGRWPMLYFSVEGLPGLVHIENGGPMSALPSLKPLVEDASLRRLRQEYAGHRVWGYGNLGGQCVAVDRGEFTALGLDNHKPCRLLHLVRISGTPTELSIGTKINVIGGANQSAFTTSRPLVAILTPPPHTRMTSFSMIATRGRRSIHEKPEDDPALQITACHTLYTQFADAWDFERTYSLVSPRDAGRHWPRILRKAVLSGRLCTGMTPAMVARTLGYPNTYGTAAQVEALAQVNGQSLWEYDYLSPFHYCVSFQSGKVTSFGPDGQLP